MEFLGSPPESPSLPPQLFPRRPPSNLVEFSARTHWPGRPRRPSTPPEVLQYQERGRELRAIQQDFENLVYNIKVFLTYILHMFYICILYILYRLIISFS
jgi:hypothetical protein